MTSQIESGISTYVGRFRQLIDVCPDFDTGTPKYKQTFVEANINNLL